MAYIHVRIDMYQQSATFGGKISLLASLFFDSSFVVLNKFKADGWWVGDYCLLLVYV